jgi:hypothetical protein
MYQLCAEGVKGIVMKLYYPVKVFFSSKAGQALPEYATILALLTVFCFVALKLLGVNFSDFFNGFSSTVQSIPTK